MWLKSKGFRATVQSAFEGMLFTPGMMYQTEFMHVQLSIIPSAEEMDGEALMTAMYSRPDCIKDVVKTYKTRLKLLRYKSCNWRNLPAKCEF